jgi:hypothetical protein
MVVRPFLLIAIRTEGKLSQRQPDSQYASIEPHRDSCSRYGMRRCICRRSSDPAACDAIADDGTASISKRNSDAAEPAELQPLDR